MAATILIIDDDIDTLNLVGLMLEKQGYSIVVANSGDQGLNKARAEHPDLIVLDIMMPDKDGIQVARELREDPALSNIPIIMFTAKSMVDDKVAGFEAGADDYLTKPTHPAELTAHVKAILARASVALPVSTIKGKALGFVGSRGGIGTSTVALNVALSLRKSGWEVIIVEMNPGRGTLALELAIPDSKGLRSVLSRPAKDINLRAVEAELVSHSSGLRLLLASPKASEFALENSVEEMQALIKNLTNLSDVVILDLGAGLRPYVRQLIGQCSLLVVVVEPTFPSIALTQALVEDLVASGVNRASLAMAVVARSHTSLQIPVPELEAEFGIPSLGVIPPAPEMAHHASQSGKPLLIYKPDSVISTEITSLAQQMAKAVSLALG